MALGTVTIVKKGVLAPGGIRFAIVDIQPTTGANYTANGEALTPAMFGFSSEIYHGELSPKDEASGTETYIVDPGNGVSTVKLVAMASDGVEIAASVDLSAKRARGIVYGK